MERERVREPGCRITLRSEHPDRDREPPVLRSINTKQRNRILGGLTVDNINPVEALENLKAIHDPHINNVKHYLEKVCEVCETLNDEASTLLCDRCDDAYHIYCLNPPIDQIPEKQWMCAQCSRDIQKEAAKQLKSKPQQKDCYRCKKDLTKAEPINYWKEPIGGSQIQMEVEGGTKTSFECKGCQRVFHTWCLNIRPNALNCTECEALVRKQLPRGSEAFAQFVEQSQIQNQTFHSNFELLPVLPTKQIYDPTRTLIISKIGLEVPKNSDNAYVLIKATTSLSYALKTQRMHFFDQQLYPKKITSPSLNRPPEKSNIRRLHPSDEQAFERFKQISSQGFFGALEIAESKTKGFYVKAIEEIPALTLLCEYTGEVLSSRHSLAETSNQCIFSLLNTSRSRTSLDICPNRYGNLSKFVCGINNSHGRRKLNVQSLRFLYQGCVRVLFFARRNIKPQETLYVDYNAGGIYEYPTEHFDVQ